MKKAVSFILALILVSMLLLPVGAEENASSMLVTKGALTYAIDDNFTIVACDPAVHVKDCTLPGIIDGYKVVRIGKDAFKDWKKQRILTKVHFRAVRHLQKSLSLQVW